MAGDEQKTICRLVFALARLASCAYDIRRCAKCRLEGVAIAINPRLAGVPKNKRVRLAK